MPVTKKLTPYFVRLALQKIKLEKRSDNDAIEEILSLFEPSETEIAISEVRERLYKHVQNDNTKATYLSQFIRRFNDDSEKCSSKLRIVTDKGSSSDNALWFVGNTEDPQFNLETFSGLLKDGLLDSQVGGTRTSTDVSLLLDMSSILLMTFNTKEEEAIWRTFDPHSKRMTVYKNGITYDVLGNLSGVAYLHMHSDQQNTPAAISAANAIRDWPNLKLIAAVGICCGDPNNVSLYDVVVSTTVYNHQAESFESAEERIPRGDSLRVAHKVEQRFRDVDKEQQRIGNMHWPKVDFSPVMSGDSLIKIATERDRIMRLHHGSHSIEMEAYGVAEAAFRGGIDWVMVKSISDFGEGKNNRCEDEQQNHAANNAAYVAFTALSSYPFLYGGGDSNSANISSPRYLNDPQQLLHEISVLGSTILPISGSFGQTIDSAQRCNPFATDVKRELLVDAMPTILNWATDPSSKQFFALLAEYGMGKTVTCQWLTNNLQERRRKGEKVPLPLYFDIRNISGFDNGVPGLDEILVEGMGHGWLTGGGNQSLTVEYFYKLLEDESGAVVIFDGLDERLTHLSTADGNVFITRLLSLAQQANAHKGTDGKPLRPKIIVSCRTQYFRTNSEQKTRLTGQDRLFVEPEDFDSMVLYPFTPEQVDAYFKLKYPEKDTAQLRKLINETNDLNDLSRRPYLMRLVAKLLPELESLRDSGSPIYSATFYKIMAMKWLERDNGKQLFLETDKWDIAESLAAYLQNRDLTAISAKELEKWLWNDWLKLSRYQTPKADQMEEDLRTATFLSRVEVAEKNGKISSVFRFAHTSLQEFFLASYLFEGLKNNEPARWNMKTPSDETLEFLGQLLAEENEQKLVDRLQNWERNDWEHNGSKHKNAEILDLGEEECLNIHNMIRNYAWVAHIKNLPTPVHFKVPDDLLKKANLGEESTVTALSRALQSGAVLPVAESLPLKSWAINDKQNVVALGNLLWIVLNYNEKEKQALLLSKYIVDYRPYHHEYEEITWQDCDLRKWLNEDFFNQLPEDLRKAITCKNPNGKVNQNLNNQWLDTPGGEQTTDKVFLLSLDEVSIGKQSKKNKYWHTDKNDPGRQCTWYDGAPVWWWLRSPGAYPRYAAYVYHDGSLHVYGYNVDRDYVGVRPALLVNLESGI